MNDFGFYLLKSACWLSGFTLVYFFFLRHERFFVLKRYFLLSGILASLFLPLLTFHYRIQPPWIPETTMPEPGDYILSVGTQGGTEATKTFDFSSLLLILYITGMTAVIVRVIINLLKIVSTIIKNKKYSKSSSGTIIRSTEFPSSFSFFKYVFINSSLEGNEFREIVNHELAHVRQKHWIDLVLMEVLRLLQWANPFVWVYTSFVKLNHEHLADEAALLHSSDPAIYKAVLVNQMFRSPVFSFSNPFNYSLNKNRFEMMKKIITSPYRKLRVLFILPVCAIVLYSFAEPVYKDIKPAPLQIVSAEKNFNNPADVIPASPDQAGEIKGTVLKQDGQPLNNVAIAVTGTGIRLRTDETGNFSLSGIPSNSYLVFSASGYLTQILKPASGKTMRVVMEKDAKAIPISSSLQNALIVIDGKISDAKYPEATKDLTPDKIASMSVLKGEQAEKKYGEKGKDGVVEITTRKMMPGSFNSRTAPEDFPTFQGRNYMEFSKWVAEQIKYPREAADKGVQGRATAIFTVQPGGTIDDIRVIGAPDPSISEEITNAIKASPLWEDAKNPEMRTPFSGTVMLKFVLPDKVLPDDTYIVVEQMPQYPGEDKALLDYIKNNTRYPEEAVAQKIQGRVIVRFVVNAKGNVEDATVIKGVHPLLDKEALRVVNSLSGFLPGSQNGKPVDVWYMVPVTFALEGSQPPVTANQGPNEPFVMVEQMPMYPGGDENLLKSIAMNTKYPENAMKNKIQGRVIVRFVVTKEGKIANASVIKGVDPELDAEALRVIGTLQDFEPGMQGGKPVDVWYMVPINFGLN